MIENLYYQGISLLRRVPPVLRARDFHLYTQGGRRLVDLWQFGGAAILGHTPPHVLRELKNTAERGLFSSFPHPQENRFTKALAQLFPGKLLRVYADEARLRHALTIAGYTAYKDKTFPDPAFSLSDPETNPREIALWRPFLQEPICNTAAIHAPVLIPVLPWALAPHVLVIDPALEALNEHIQHIPPSDMLSPVILAAATRSIYDLLAVTPQRGKVVFPNIQKMLPHSTWHRQGIYLSYSAPLDEESYGTLFLTFLERGYLLPPYRHLPLILPGILSPGEEAKLAALLQLTV